PVVARAGRLLASLERQAGTRPAALPLFEAASLVTDDGEITCSVQATDVAELPQGGVDRQDEALREALGAIDCDTLSPREALEALYRLRAMLG
ncbi:DNA mismatch repair protein MutS, partial [Endobacter medicaginis]